MALGVRKRSLYPSTQSNWAQTLRETAAYPIVSPKPSPLFWVTSSEIFTKPQKAPVRPVPRYLDQPGMIFKRIWASPVG